MKKLALILLVLTSASLVYSCKPREKCPAYGQNYQQVQPLQAEADPS